MLRRGLLPSILIIWVMVLVVTSTSLPTMTSSAQADPTPTLPVVQPGSANPPVDLSNFQLPPTLAELIEQFPGLQSYLDQVEGTPVEDLDLSDFYIQVMDIYDEHGPSGVAVFLEDTGLLDKLGIPFGYLNLLTVYDTGGWAAVEEVARMGRLINDQDELVGYMALESEEDLSDLTTELEGLGVSVYDYREDTGEVEIGIPLALLGRYRTPDGLLGYLVAVMNVPHASGFRVPPLVISEDLNFRDLPSTGSQWVGASAWHDAGITGKGVRVGILDMGFAGILQAGADLPEQMMANREFDLLDRQPIDHGTACAMIVHRVAPDAELFIAYYDGTSYSSFLSALQFLADNDVDIISHSAGSSVGPRNGSWGDSLLITDFVQYTGILWVNSAGNEALSHTILQADNDTDDFRDYGVVAPVVSFIAFAPETYVIMNWDGNWIGGEKTNYMFAVYDKDFNEVVVAADPHSGRKNDFPFQATWFQTTPEEIYYLVISQTRGTENHILDIFVGPDAFLEPWAQVPGYSVIMPADADVVLTVGATGLSSDELELYSSQGPTIDGRIKPDITAPTNERLPGYEEYGFGGTSGSAPLASGAAALVLHAFPEMTEREIRAYLMANVVDLGVSGPDNAFGSGRLHLPEPEPGDN